MYIKIKNLKAGTRYDEKMNHWLGLITKTLLYEKNISYRQSCDMMS